MHLGHTLIKHHFQQLLTRKILNFFLYIVTILLSKKYDWINGLRLNQNSSCLFTFFEKRNKALDG